MTNQLTNIQSQIESFLQTYPESEAINSLIYRLKEYESERQRQAIKADLAWKEQLPGYFPQSPRHKDLREKFRRMFNQLNEQGITVTFSPDCSNRNLVQWLLTGGNKIEGEKFGRLKWCRQPNQWTIDGFCFQDEAGNLLNEFNDVEIL